MGVSHPSLGFFSTVPTYLDIKQLIFIRHVMSVLLLRLRMEGSQLPTTRMASPLFHLVILPNLRGFIVTVAEDGGCGEIFHRNEKDVNIPSYFPVFGEYPWDLYISNNFRVEVGLG
jgi:hypothetical protein